MFCTQTFEEEEFARALIPGTQKPYTAKDTAGNACHAGFDIQAPENERTLYAVCDGHAAVVDFGPAYGTQTAIRSARTDGKAGAFYAHQARRLVKDGEKVEWGQPVGVMGNTSSRKIAVHLHFSWCPTFDVARFSNLGAELRDLKEAYMPYSKEKDALLQRILDECADRKSKPAGAFTGATIDLIRKLGPRADDLVKHLDEKK